MVAFLVAAIIMLLSLTWWIYYRHLMTQCYLEPNIWCWTDWVCLNNTPQGFTCPTQEVYNCKPGVLRDDNYCAPGGAGEGTLGCNCNASGDSAQTCLCAWNGAGSAWVSDGGTCGTKYCDGKTGAALDNCQPN